MVGERLIDWLVDWCWWRLRWWSWMAVTRFNDNKSELVQLLQESIRSQQMHWDSTSCVVWVSVCVCVCACVCTCVDEVCNAMCVHCTVHVQVSGACMFDTFYVCKFIYVLLSRRKAVFRIVEWYECIWWESMCSMCTNLWACTIWCTRVCHRLYLCTHIS